MSFESQTWFVGLILPLTAIEKHDITSIRVLYSVAAPFRVRPPTCHFAVTLTLNPRDVSIRPPELPEDVGITPGPRQHEHRFRRSHASHPPSATIAHAGLIIKGT